MPKISIHLFNDAIDAYVNSLKLWFFMAFRAGKEGRKRSYNNGKESRDTLDRLAQMYGQI